LTPLFDIPTGTVTEFHQLAGGNFDIQYDHRGDTIFIAGLPGYVSLFDLSTKQSQTIAEGGLITSAIGIAVSPKGFLYITDAFSGKVLTLDRRTGSVTILADEGPNGEPFINPDGILLDRRGNAIMSDHGGRIYRISPMSGAVEVAAEIPGRVLNGMALTRDGMLIVTASLPEPGGVFEVDLKTGSVRPIYDGFPFRTPEDVAIDSKGNIYILDSDFTHSFPDFLPSLYVIRNGSNEPEPLFQGEPFGGIVDILLGSFLDLP
jgi:DNA-binding beta-propeller fold protein YncE